MHSSSRTTLPLKPRRLDTSRRTNVGAEPKIHGPGFRREDKNMNTLSASSPRRGSKVPTESSRAKVGGARGPVLQSRLGLQKPPSGPGAKPKPKSIRAAAVSNVAPPPAPPLPLPLLDPNCNEPSLPCLCCDGRSPQDNNSMFNHNHNNNNTVSIRHQLKLQPPPPPPPLRQEGSGVKAQAPPLAGPAQPPAAPSLPAAKELEAQKSKESLNNVDNKKVEEEEEEEESSADVDIEVDVDEDDDEEEGVDNEDEDDDDTLVPSCCDCPSSLLDFSLSSSTSSSSSTSISSCSDLELDCADLSMSLSSSQTHSDLSLALSPQDHTFAQTPESTSPSTLPLDVSKPTPLCSMSHSPPPLCSPDEGYPSGPDSPSSDYLGIKGQAGHLGSGVSKLGLMDFLESMGEFGKMERFSQVIQVARWEFEEDSSGDLLRDRLDHLDRLEKVNRQVKLAHIARLHENGLDLADLGEADFSDVLDEMGNVDIPWKLYKGRSMGDSQEFSDAGVDLTAPSDTEEALASDVLTPSPVEPPPRPPKPPARHASVNSDLHTYININRDPSSICTSPSPILSTFSPTSPSFSTFRCEKPLPPSPPSIPPLPVAQPVPYFSLYAGPPPPSVPSLLPPIPPPRRRHLARKEAQRLASLQAEQDKTLFCLPPPTSRPPPLPPHPVISISASSPPAIPPPPALPPPPSFHALDVEIRKLLMLAGLTQAELQKLSPELGDCVGGLEEQVDPGNLHLTRPGEPQERETREREERKEEEECDIDGMTLDGWRDGGKLDVERHRGIDGLGGRGGEEEDKKEESRSWLRTTSFTEMAKRRNRRSGFGAPEPYYSTTCSNTSETKATNMTFGTFSYSPVFSDPPPPPRPLPPVPPTLPPIKVCTLTANSSRPDRFDWLMAFSPDGETPPLPPRKHELVIPPRTTPPPKMTSSSESTSGRGSGSGSGSGSKVTTFKELRNRSNTSFPTTQIITDPDPDPNIITPDPDILYNLKWRREKMDGDDIQWEYTSQAQAVFMNPPPLTSLAALREMFKKEDDAIGQAEGRSSQIGCSASEGDLWTRRMEREGDGEMREEEEGQGDEEMEVRGRADGGRTLESRTTAPAGRSASFTSSKPNGLTSWMGENGCGPVRGLGLSSLCLQEKRALVSSVSVAVEAVLAQFSSSRTLVQKALSGDSSVNPSVGRLALQCLCPALRSLLSDGLKPHQNDLIAGRRPNSAWGLVQASTKSGPGTAALHRIQTRVGELTQLKQSKHRFNSFLLGLLNNKLLDFWLSHLQSCTDVLETFYQPTSFMRLSSTSCQPLFEELLLLLQPLSLLTFNLDLLFQYHHLEPANQSPDIPNPPNKDAGFRLSPRGSAVNWLSRSYFESLSELDSGSIELETTSVKASSCSLADSVSGELGELANGGEASVKVPVGVGKTSPQLLWVQEKEIRNIAPPRDEEASLTQQAGQVIQEGWGAVMRWGGRLGQNLTELSQTSRPPGFQGHAQQTDPSGSERPRGDGAAAVPWNFGRLFGASKSSMTPPLPSRRPSQWLAPGVTVLTRMVSSSSTPILQRALEPQADCQIEMQRQREEEESEEDQDMPRPLRSVRTLCDHSGTGAELSFQKGEELLILGGVDHDWIRCRQGEKEGLVPIGYTSLIM